ncbi:MAG TPA: type I DNA topoisomerase [Acidimicrobiales bacterium]|nr:type I DNA topoisomerase [Acidimicrobiales bacterium]
MAPTDVTPTTTDTGTRNGARGGGTRPGNGAKPLVIVESPAKAKTIAGLLGSGYVVESSIGHIRDLPRRADEVPAAYKGEAWSRLGVDVDNGFKPLYVVSSDKKSQVAKLKQLVKQASEVYLASDEDREGESIAWHLLEVLAPRVPVKRMVFHEITRPAIERAVNEWRDLDRRLVDAQEARRILDRLYGYEVSPVLWKKIMPRLSAGRVQSVATRMVVERERSRIAFRPAGWWGIDATFTTAATPAAEGAPSSFSASLAAVDGVPLASGRDFEQTGTLASPGSVVVLDEDAARTLATGLDGAHFTVKSLTEKPFRRSPAAPFMTSTLQQEAGRKLRFGSRRAMQVAQRLYEDGWITYMRTDSTTLSSEALSAARTQAAALYGPDFVPAQPRRYERKVKNAQEAHEAIRPAGDTFRTPDEAARSLSGDELRLYELIWKRTVASQMNDATGTSAQVRLVGTSTDTAGAGRREAEFSASGKVIQFPGFLRAYVEGEDDPEAELADREVHLPPMAEGDPVSVSDLEPGSHTTQPPARYTEASLVKAMEELGVGRPSTYASVIATILDRGYVWKKGTALVPSFTAFAVVGLLERYFSDLVDYGFTASMEDDLDAIAAGDEESLPWLTRFYFGDGASDAAKDGMSDGKAGSARNGQGLGLKREVSTYLGEIDAREINSIPIGTGTDGVAIVARVGRYGPYLQRGDDRVSVPDDLAPDELTVGRAEELLAAPSSDRVLGEDPETGLPVQVRAGRFGPYVQLGELVDGGPKPRTSSLFASMSPATLTFDQALDLLRIPRVVGTDPATGEEIVAHNGRFGPYLKRGSDTRSLVTEDQILTVDLDEAMALFAQPKTRGRNAKGPLRELGADPGTGVTMVVKDGRFGPYVTDGTTNASLRRGDDVESLTDERAAELLAERRAAGPATRKQSAKKAAAKKATAKKAAAKKATAKKATAKKATARKTTAKTASTRKKATATAGTKRRPANPATSHTAVAPTTGSDTAAEDDAALGAAPGADDPA